MQIDKGKKEQTLGKSKSQKVVRVSGKRSSSSKRVIHGVPLNVRIKDLEEHMKAKNNRVMSAKRMVGGVKKKWDCPDRV